MSYKMLVTDIDDTLLNDNLLVTEATKEALTAATDQQVMFTLATGRMYKSAQKIAKQLDMNVPIITYQGALIKYAQSEEVIYEQNILPEDANHIIALCAQHELHLQVYAEDIPYVRAENEKSRHYYSISKVPFQIEPDFEKLIEKPIPKMLIIGDPQKLSKLTPEFKQLLGDRVYITKSKPNFLEFTNRAATKGQALTFLAQHFGVKVSEIIAIGDSWNDLDMIETAGLGVAMANAVEDLKQAADYITLSNNDDGVKHVIEHFILNQKN